MLGCNAIMLNAIIRCY